VGDGWERYTRGAKTAPDEIVGSIKRRASWCVDGCRLECCCEGVTVGAAKRAQNEDQGSEKSTDKVEHQQGS
jgi:hypothetical protein